MLVSLGSISLVVSLFAFHSEVAGSIAFHSEVAGSTSDVNSSEDIFVKKILLGLATKGKRRRLSCLGKVKKGPYYSLYTVPNAAFHLPDEQRLSKDDNKHDIDNDQGKDLGNGNVAAVSITKYQIPFFL